MWSVPIDSQVIRGLAQASGLITSVWAGERLIATSQNEPTVVPGLKEGRVAVVKRVLEQNERWVGLGRFGAESIYMAYAPLMDHDQVAVGMVSVGIPQASVWATVRQVVELTFLVAIGLMLGSLIPAYLVSRSLAKQLH